AMARQLDLAEMHKFELARDLSETLLRKWLVSYKLRHWVRTETRGLPVTDAMREQRAAEVAKRLTDHQYWLSHGRPIPMQTLRDELNLLIDDLDDHPRLKAAVQRYHLFALE